MRRFKANPLLVNPQRVLLAALLAIFIFAEFFACGANETPPPETAARPVSFVDLKVTEPRLRLRLTGSVEPWKAGRLGFEVAGRVEWIAEAGTIVQGREYDVDGRLISEGDVIARLDPRRHELGLASARAELEAALGREEAVRVELEGVLTQQLREAEARLDRARRDYERIGGLVDEGVLSASEGDRARAEHEAADAIHNQLVAKSRMKEVELKIAQALARQAGTAEQRSKLDLENCTLIAPFSGQIAETFVNAGAQVQPSLVVASLVLMNPLKIEVAVSANTERKINFGDAVSVFPPGFDAPVPGVVHLKDTIADSATRTFKVTIMVQNRRTLGRPASNSGEGSLPEFERTWPVLQIEIAGKELPFVEAGTLQENAQGHFVWQIDDRTLGQNWKNQSPVVTLRQRYVTPGARSYSLLGLLTFRELAEFDSLGDNALLASGVPPGVNDGDEALLARRQWMLRPGDLLDVSFEDEGPGKGLYLPMGAILKSRDLHYVYAIDEVSPEVYRVRKVEIALEGNVGELWKISSPELSEGDRIVLGGAPYLADDELVRPRPAEDGLK